MKYASELIEMRQKAKEEWEKEKSKFRAELLKNSIELCETKISPALELEATNFSKESIKTKIKFVEVHKCAYDTTVLYLISLNKTVNDVKYYECLTDVAYDKNYIEKFLQEYNLDTNWNEPLYEYVALSGRYHAPIELTVEAKIK